MILVFSLFVFLAACGEGDSEATTPTTAAVAGGTGAVPPGDEVTIAMVTTVAGAGAMGFARGGFADGPVEVARFSDPYSVALDGAGNIYVADTRNERIRKIASDGVVSTLAGTGTPGFTDGPGDRAQFALPLGMAVDPAGNLYVAELNGLIIRKIDPMGTVTTFAGSHRRGYLDGPALEAQFNNPSDVTVDNEGNLYVADTGNHSIRKITPSGAVTTLAGSPARGYADGRGSVAQFHWPSGLAVDTAGNVYVADTRNHRIRRITPAGEVTTLAGSGPSDGLGGFADGPKERARFAIPTDVAVDTAGNVYVADFGNHSIRKIALDGFVTTIAGAGRNTTALMPGHADGPAYLARFAGPWGIALDGEGNIYVADRDNNRIRKIAFAQLPGTPTPGPDIPELGLPALLRQGDEVPVLVYADTEPAPTACADLVPRMVPASAAAKVPGKVIRCTVDEVVWRHQFLQGPDGVLRLRWVELLLLAKPDLPSGAGKRNCVDIQRWLLPADEDPGSAGFVLVCDVEPPVRGEEPPRFKIWSRLPADAAVTTFPEDIRCWEISRYLGPGRGHVEPLNIPCILR